MSFQARRLRVQLPCGEQTVVEAQALQPTPTACPFATCGFVTPATISASPSSAAARLPGAASVCHQFHTTCNQFLSPICAMDTFACGCSVTFNPTVCQAGTVDPDRADPGRPRGAAATAWSGSEAELKEIEKAEQALKEREG